MATVALHDSDGKTFPNLALMKLAAWHRIKGDTLERFMPLMHSAGRKDVTVYSSKVFSWTPEYAYLPAGTQKGGTGYGISGDLPDAVEHICPDYDFYGVNFSEYWCYVLVNDVDDAYDRVQFLESLKITPFAQPYRDWAGTEPTFKQKMFARWCDRAPIRKTTPWPVFWEQHQHKEPEVSLRNAV